MLNWFHLGAVSLKNEDITFNQYFEPTCHISKGSSRVTGLTINGLDLCLNGDVITDTVSAADGIEMFILWLHAHFSNGCILVAHNGKRFDFPILKRYLQLTSKTYDELYGIDSREIFKAHFPDLNKNKMENLVDEFLPPRKYQHHDALVDAQNLSAVIKSASKKKGVELSEFLRVKEKDLCVLKWSTLK